MEFYVDIYKGKNWVGKDLSLYSSNFVGDIK